MPYRNFFLLDYYCQILLVVLVYVSKNKYQERKNHFFFLYRRVILTSICFFHRTSAVRDNLFSFSDCCLYLLKIISIISRNIPTNIPPAINKKTSIQKNIYVS